MLPRKGTTPLRVAHRVPSLSCMRSLPPHDPRAAAFPVTHPRTNSVPGDEAKPAASSTTTARHEISPPPREDLVLVQSRDADALGRFFDHYFQFVFGLVMRLLGDRTAAEDATQDVLLKVHRAVDRLDPDRDPGPWLTTIAYNVCRDRWRSTSDRMERHSASIDGQPELALRLQSSDPDPEQIVLSGERDQVVQEALMRLPESAREVIVLHDYQGLPHDEVAELLGVSHAAIRKRYSRALQTLGEILRETMET